ncbi:hypothetical protein J4462_02235 [Candidatus Pacearchaeota archaeon]|nr:hypothetical protein [Candidatus Pacearchaeota archaeon]
MENPDEPRNEKGLTRSEYYDMLEKRHKRIGKIVMSIFLVGASSAAYFGVKGAFTGPQQPEGYQQYVDANATLKNLQDFKDEFEIPRMPYSTTALDDASAGAFGIDKEKESKLEQAVSIVRDDITKMESKNPEYAGFENKISDYKNMWFNRMGFVAWGTALAGLIGAYMFDARPKKLGSEDFYFGEERK